MIVVVILELLALAVQFTDLALHVCVWVALTAYLNSPKVPSLTVFKQICLSLLTPKKRLHYSAMMQVGECRVHLPLKTKLRRAKLLIPFESKAFCCFYKCVLTISNWLSSVFLLSHSEDSQDENYSSRWRSIRVMYFTMFLSSVGKAAQHCTMVVFHRK